MRRAWPKLAKWCHHGIGHAITVELITPDGMPSIVKITWLPQPTVADPRHRARRRSDAGPSLHGIGRDQGEAVGLTGLELVRGVLWSC